MTERPKQTGSAKTHAKRRRDLRRKLVNRGWSPAAVELAVDQMAEAQAARRAQTKDATGAAQRLALQEADLVPADPPMPVDVDDAPYKPTRIDPLRRGPARVNAVTAKAATRKNAMTKFEYDRLQERSG